MRTPEEVADMLGSALEHGLQEPRPEVTPYNEEGTAFIVDFNDTEAFLVTVETYGSLNDDPDYTDPYLNGAL